MAKRKSDAKLPTQGASLNEVRVLIEVLGLNTRWHPKTWDAARVAQVVIDELIELFEGLALGPRSADESNEAYDERLRFDRGAAQKDLLARWEAMMDRHKKDLAGLAEDEKAENGRVENGRVTELLRAALHSIGMPNDAISSRIGRLPKSDEEKNPDLMHLVLFRLASCDLRAGALTTFQDFWTRYRRWCDEHENAEPRLSQRALVDEVNRWGRLTHHVFERDGKRLSGWRGIALKPDEEFAQNVKSWVPPWNQGIN